jgi:hypothetical protein
MKRPKDKPDSLPQYDYALALQTAVSWLGDRHLLAQPVTRRVEEHKPYFVEQSRWNDARRSTAPGIRKH